MAKRSDTSKRRTAGSQTASRNKRTARYVIPDAVEDYIEAERERLMRAHSVLACALTAMEADDAMPTEGPHYPSLIELARDMIDESIKRLDSVNLEAAEAAESDAAAKLPTCGGGYKVEEARPIFWYGRRAANEPVNHSIDAEVTQALTCN